MDRTEKQEGISNYTVNNGNSWLPIPHNAPGVYAHSLSNPFHEPSKKTHLDCCSSQRPSMALGRLQSEHHHCPSPAHDLPPVQLAAASPFTQRDGRKVIFTACSLICAMGIIKLQSIGLTAQKGSHVYGIRVWNL